MNTGLDTHCRGGPTLAAMQEMYSYCLAHPRSPSAVRQPQLSTAAIFGSLFLGRVWRKGSLESDRAWKQHSARLTRNIWTFWDRRQTQRKFAIQPIRARSRAAWVQYDFAYNLSPSRLHIEFKQPRESNWNRARWMCDPCRFAANGLY